MQFIRDIYARRQPSDRPVISFEFFPPKTAEGDASLLEKTVPALMAAKPDYCSVTYGAGGTTRDKTLMLVDQIQQRHGLTSLAHLTCVNHTREQISALLGQIQKLDCRNLLALRGDPPGGGEFRPTPGGFEYAAQLVEFIRQKGDFTIAVAGFPEGHAACAAGKLADWEFTARKVKTGADFIITQLFFDNQDYFRFCDFLRTRGVTAPVVPGVIAILSASQIKKFTQMCGARIPADLARELEKVEHDDAAAAEFGIEYATRQCRELLDRGAPGLHFYTLNKPHSTLRVVRNLGLG
jgi:methylenetetrahydrofolate reductase (NADPH)